MSLRPSTVRQAARSLLRTPTLTVAALLCLALGIGSTTAVTSAAVAALLRPLPFPKPDRLVSVYRTTPNFDTGPFSPATVLDLRQLQTIDVAGIAFRSGLLTRPEGSVRVQTPAVTANLFSMLGVSAERGRLFLPEDEVDGAEPVLILGHEFWREQFGADLGIVDRTVLFNGELHRVLGVLPPAFRIPNGSGLVRGDVWIPLRFTPGQLTSRRNNFIRLLGRLAPGTSLAQADNEVQRISAAIVEANPVIRGEGIRIAGLAIEHQRPVRRPLQLLLGAVGLVLLVAASNVACLLLARGAARKRDIALRVAMGATPRHIAQRVLLEAGLLVGGGVIGGLVVAWVGIRFIGVLAARYLPQVDGLSLNPTVILSTLGVSVAVALGCGVVPAVLAGRVHPQSAIGAESTRIGTDGRQHGFLRGLVAAEITLALVLLLGAGLVGRGFLALVSESPGFDPDPLLTMTVTVDPARYQNAPPSTTFLPAALDRIRAVPGVEDAGSITLIPYDNWGNNFNIWYEGQPGDDPTTLPLTESRAVTPSLFATLGLTLRTGRLFGSEDETPNAPTVVLVNQALVDRDFPSESPLGKRFHLNPTTFATIVGVVSSVKNAGPEEPIRPEVYYDMQTGWGNTTLPLVVRTRGRPEDAVRSVTEAIRTVDPTVAISQVQTMNEVMAGSVGRPRFYLILLGSFAGLALVLTMAGLYGLMSYSVARRIREIGIRMALGSTARRTRRLVLEQGGRLIVAGLVIGGVVSALATRLLEGFLFGVSPLDPTTWVVVTLALVASAVLAIMVPAVRATRVDPLIAMRTE